MPKLVRQGPIRLAILLQDLKFGGTQRQAIELARGLDPKRYRIEVWALMGGVDLLPQAEGKVSRWSGSDGAVMYGRRIFSGSGCGFVATRWIFCSS